MATKRKPTDKVQLKIRLQESLRSRVEEEAKVRGASLNDEIVRRLEQTFDRQDLLDQILEAKYGAGLAALVGVLADTANVVAQTTIAGRLFGGGKPVPLTDEVDQVLSDAWTYGQVELAMVLILKGLRPSGSTAAPAEIERLGFGDAGRTFAELTLSNLRAPKKKIHVKRSQALLYPSSQKEPKK